MMESRENAQLEVPPQQEALSRGTNQSGVRLYNERLVLSLIRRHGSLAKAEIARLTGLSPQTTTVIVNRLETDGLLLAGEPQRGRVGQPLVPYALNPDGAYSIGMMIGRRGCDLVLVDFNLGFRKRMRLAYAYPTPEALLDFVREGIASLTDSLKPAERLRIAGLGIATPFELWSWEQDLGAPAGALAGWRSTDLAQEIAQFWSSPIHVFNDATAACAAELTFGRGVQYRDFAYAFIGTFIGGGIVLEGNIYPGRSGNAGALGSMPIMAQDTGAPQQLIRAASVHSLERRARAAGLNSALIWESPDDWSAFAPMLDDWIGEVGAALAQAAVSAAAVIDFEAIVIDGIFPTDVRARIVARIRDEIARLDLQGLTPFEVREGSIGRDARLVGGAALPLLATFARDREVLFKDKPLRL